MNATASSTVPKADDFTDVLPLLALKVAPRQFDVNYRFSSISIRDQMVRAQMLVKALKDTGALGDYKMSSPEDTTIRRAQLLICGAGPAGVAAAMEAEKLGVSFVLLDKSKDFPSGVLNSTATRYVSTAMYEWPHTVYNTHEFPLSRPMLLGNDPRKPPSLDLNISRPLLISDFSKVFESHVRPSINAWAGNFDRTTGALNGNVYIPHACMDDATKRKLRSLLQMGSSMNAHSSPSIKLGPISFADLSAPLPGKMAATDAAVKDKRDRRSTYYKRIGPYEFEYVIYAAGFGHESREYAPGKLSRTHHFVGFWDKDDVQKDWLAFAPDSYPSVVVLGSGDGALQDALRCLIDPGEASHPLEIWNRLLKGPRVGAIAPDLTYSQVMQHALREIAACDGYTSSGSMWTQEKHIYASLDLRFREIAQNLVREQGYWLLRAANVLIRSDVSRVVIVTLKGYFTKAYALNRFLIILFDELFGSGTKGGRKLYVEAGSVERFTVDKKNKRGGVVRLANGRTLEGDLVIIRGGLEDRLTQSIGITGNDTARAELGRIPPPIRLIG